LPLPERRASQFSTASTSSGTHRNSPQHGGIVASNIALLKRSVEQPVALRRLDCCHLILERRR
jgi:hypothetical protein